MISKRIVERQNQTPYLTWNHSHTGVTRRDDSEIPIPQVNTDTYGILSAIYAPKLPTNVWVTFRGTDILNKWHKFCGYAKTSVYGRPMTYMEKSAEAGFITTVMNVREDDATFPNMYIALNVEKEVDEAGVEVEASVFVEESTALPTTWAIDFDSTKLPGVDPIVEIKVPRFKLEFGKFYIDQLNRFQDLDKYFNIDAKVVNIVPSSDAVDGSKIHIPLWSLASKAADSYGNRYIANFSTMSEKIDGSYPYFTCNIVDNQNVDYSFNFATFDIARGAQNMGFFDRATSVVNASFTSTDKVSAIEMFRPWQIDRDNSIDIEDYIPQFVDKTLKGILAKIKVQFPTFDETTCDDWIDKIEEPLMRIAASFTREDTQAAFDVETPLSYINPWTVGTDLDMPLMSVVSADKNIQFEGGSEGSDELKAQLKKKGFSFDIKLTRTILDPLPGDPLHTTTEEYYPFRELFIKAYRGELDDAIFDPILVPDSIMFSDGYPNEVQEVMDDLSRPRENVINFINGRCDFTFFRTPPYSVQTIDQVFNWQEGFLNQTKNINMKVSIGSWRFTDTTTKGQTRFQGWYDYLGTDSALYAYLISTTSDSFATGSASEILKGADGSELLIPSSPEDKEELVRRCIIYWKMRSNGRYSLGEDLAYNIGYDSVLKSIGSGIQFNNILRRAELVLRDNQNINPTDDNLEQLKRDVETAIARPSRHFNDKVRTTIYISDHEMEIGKRVVLCDIRVTGHEYSNKNRLQITSIREATDTTTTA